jgi:uncharacterized protein
VRLSPRACCNRLDGVVRLADGATTLKVSVTAPPEEGRANDALLQLLAREWDLPLRDLRIAGGRKSRRKLVHVIGDPAALLRRISTALAALPRA